MLKEESLYERMFSYAMDNWKELTERAKCSLGNECVPVSTQLAKRFYCSEKSAEAVARHVSLKMKSNISVRRAK